MPALFQQQRPARSGRVSFVILLVLSVVLITVYSLEDESGVVHTLQSRFLAASVPVNAVGASVGASLEDVGTAVSDAAASQSTLSALIKQNEELRQLVANAEEYRQEAMRLEELLAMKQSSSVDGKVAHIIGRSTTAWDRSLSIDLGSDQGVESGMTVLGSTGVIGQITHVFPSASTVRLLTDPDSGAAVKIQSSRIDAIVRGSLDGRLRLEDIEGDEIPEEGDVVLTSGLGGSYKSGLVVGTITSVSRTAGNSAGDIIVEPNDSATLLEEVLVVMDTASDQDNSVTPTINSDAAPGHTDAESNNSVQDSSEVGESQ